MGGYAFFSYARGSGLGASIAAFMQREELPPWIDNELRPGESWAEVIEQRIAGAAAFVVIMDEASATSDYVKKELALAQKLRKPVVPVLAGREPFPELADRQFALWNKIGLPEYGFSEYLRELLAPGVVPSARLQRLRVDHFVRKTLRMFFRPGAGSVEFGVGMGHDHGISDDQPLNTLDELDWVEVVLELNENVPGLRIEDHFGSDFRSYGARFRTPVDLVDALMAILTWEQIRVLGRHRARMAERGADSGDQRGQIGAVMPSEARAATTLGALWSGCLARGRRGA